jgi:hypothetical protein
VWLRVPVGLALLACSAERHPPPNRPLAFVVPEPDTSEPADPELDAALARVARARGLEFRRRPLLARVPRSVLVQHALAWLDTRTPEPTRRAEAALLAALELVPAGFSWHEALGAALTARLSAFYDSQSGQIWLDGALPAGERRRVLAHELVHVLGDQHFGLGVSLAAASSSADARSALLAVAEGDAVVLVQELEAAGLVAPEPSRADAPGAELPGAIERSLAATYVDGQAVVRRVFDTGGWADVNALYAAPPATTHALSSPDFPRTDAALPAPASTPRRIVAPPGDGWSLVADDTFGERAFRVILEEWTPATRAFELARHWSSDRLVCFERGGQRALVWEVHTDAETAIAAEAVLREGLRLPPSPPSRRASTTSCRAHRDGGVVGLSRRGQNLLIVAARDVPARDGCASLESWVEQLEVGEHAAVDPGPRRLTGPD